LLILGGVVVGAVVAFAHPAVFLWLRPFLQPAFAVAMFLLGTLVLPEQLRAFARSPSRVLAGLACQYTIMPLTAAAVALFFDDPLVRAGIVLVGCMPGAMASNVMTLLFRGDLVLSVTLTTLATLLSPLVLAVWLPLFSSARLRLPVGPLVWNATWMVVLPVAAGIAARAFGRRPPPGWEAFATAAASASIVLIVLVVVASNRESLAVLGPALGLAMLGLNLVAYGLALLAAAFLRWPPAQRRTLVIEVGMQNAGMGSVLALAHLGQAGAVPSAFYTALCVVTVALALPFRRKLGLD
jgi:BASS family bile acid:Na+ symporter